MISISSFDFFMKKELEKGAKRRVPEGGKKGNNLKPAKWKDVKSSYNFTLPGRKFVICFLNVFGGFYFLCHILFTFISLFPL